MPGDVTFSSTRGEGTITRDEVKEEKDKEATQPGLLKTGEQVIIDNQGYTKEELDLQIIIMVFYSLSIFLIVMFVLCKLQKFLEAHRFALINWYRKGEYKV